METGIASDGTVTLGLITLASLIVNAVTIYRWISDYITREAVNDQAFHLIFGLALSVTKRTSMIVRRIDSLKEHDRANDESMIFLENMWADSMSTVDNLLGAAKALKPKKANSLPFDASDLLKVTAEKTRAPKPAGPAT